MSKLLAACLSALTVGLISCDENVEPEQHSPTQRPELAESICLSLRQAEEPSEGEAVEGEGEEGEGEPVEGEAESESEAEGEAESETEAGCEESEAEAEVEAESEFTCPDGMVYITGGTFQMGCLRTEGSRCGGDEDHPYDVTLTEFCLDRTEVTADEYEECPSGTCSRPTGCIWGTPNWGTAGRGSYPTNCMSWNDAEAYCRWRTGCTGTGCGLPTEAQWEYAARGAGASPRTYPWGEELPNCARADFDAEGVPFGGGGASCNGEGTSPVCNYPNGNTPEGGLCDMAGNVSEWVRDYYGPGMPGIDPENTDPEWARARGEDRRVLRGGNYSYSSDTIRSSARDALNPVDRRGGYGFRCASY